MTPHDSSPRRSPWDRTPADRAPGDSAAPGTANTGTANPGIRSTGAGNPAGRRRRSGAPGPGGAPRRATAEPSRTSDAPTPAPAARPRVVELTVLLLVTTALGCAGMAGALDGGWWVWPVAATVVTVLLVTGVARWLRLPSVLVTVLGLAALLLALTALHLGDHALLGFIPTGGTFSAAAQLWRGSGDFVAHDAAPYGPDPGLAFVLSVLVGLVTVFMETALVGLRMAGLACLGLLALLVVPALTLPGSVGVPGLAAAALAALALLAGSRIWGATRAQRIAPAPGGLPRALLVVAGVLAVVLLVPSVIPGFYNGAFPQGSSLTSDRASGVGPLRAVGQDLRSDERTRRFSYTSSDDQPQYMRLLTLSDFSRDEWFPDTDGLDEDLTRLGAAARDAVPGGREVTAKVSFEDYTEHWLPTPYAPADVAGLGTDGWGWNPRDLSVYSASTGMSGAGYTVTAVLPDATPDALRAAPPAADDAAMAEYLRLPADRPGSVADAARQYTEGARTDYDRALAIQNRLRKDFREDIDAPLAQGYDAGGMGSLDTFMRTRAGYSGHFAPAMALMAREVGIPSRVAVGYLPTAATTEEDGGTSFPVGTGDAHAWPELYFEKIGWVRFEPTPGVPSTPGYAPESAPDPADGASPSASPSATPSTSEQPQSTPPSTPQSSETGGAPSPQPTVAPQQPDAPPQQPVGFAVPWWLAATAVLVPLLLVLAVLPRWLRARRRRARTAAMGDAALSPQRRAHAAWDEFVALARDYGVTARPADTPRVRARRLAEGIPAAHESVDRVVADLETASYGAPDAGWTPRTTPEDLARIREQYRNRAPRGQRFRGTWWPASLRRDARR